MTKVDVVVGSKTFNIICVIEDEALLAIPNRPNMQVCPDVGSFKQSEAAENQARNSASTSGKSVSIRCTEEVAMKDLWAYLVALF